jgi:predicted phage-related endonuclease
MIIHSVLQGSDDWLELRGKYLTASEAPVIMAASNKMKRDELLAIKAGYTEKQYSDWVQRNLFDKGHQAEAMARPIVEAMIGEELYPVTGSEGLYLASFDGLTMMEDIGFEHKMWNEELAECVRRKELPAEYYWQLEHQLLVCKDMKKVIFVVSDGTPDRFVSMEYFRVPGRAEELQRGWRQFQTDLMNYEHVVIPAKPEAEVIEAFPALSVALIGEVRSSNLPVFKSRAMAFIDSINTDLQTDEDFANAEEAVKFCEKAEKEIDLVKSQALSQTSTIDELFRAMDQIKALMREKRLMLDRLVKNRKESLRSEIIDDANRKLKDDIAKANEEFRPVVVTGVVADFAGAAKNKRTFLSLRSAVNDELTRARLMLAEKRDHVRASIKTIRDAGDEYGFLFSDVQQLVEKPHDFLEMIVRQRVSEHAEAQQRKILAEAQRIADQAEIARKVDEERSRLAAEKDSAAKTVADSHRVFQQPAAGAATESVITKPRVTPVGAGQSFRPTDDDIIQLIANHYRVNEFKAVEWLQSMNLDAATNRVVGGGR